MYWIKRDVSGNLKISGRFLWILCGLFFSCSSMKAGFRSGDWLGLLPAESSVYMGMDSPSPYLAPLLELKGTGLPRAATEILEKTVALYAAVYQSGEEEIVSVILRGHYSYFLIHMALDLAPDWETSGDPVLYFIHESGLKLSNPDWSTILLTNGNIEDLRNAYITPSQPASPLPLEMTSLMGNRDLYFFFPGFSDILPGEVPLNKQKFQVREAWFTLEKTEEKLGGGFHLQGAEEAAQFKTGFKSFLLWWLREGGLSTSGVLAKIKKLNLFPAEEFLIFTDLPLSPGEWTNCLKGLFPLINSDLK